MPKSKSQMDAELLQSTKVDDNEISQINTRDSNSTHPVDCNCNIHHVIRFDKQYSLQEEVERREELDYPLP